jgi:hypothetical protein
MYIKPWGFMNQNNHENEREMTNDRQFMLIQRPNLAKCRWNPEQTRSREFQALSSKVPP